MNVDTALQSCRAVRHFDPKHKMTKKTRDKLLANALESPAISNLRNWHFVIVDDPEQRWRIREAAWDQQQVTDASMLVILCADLMAWEDEALLHWRTTSATYREPIIPTCRQSYGTLDPMQRDEVMRSCGIVAQTLILTASTMGYDACPMEGFDFDAVADFINLPDDYAVCMLVAIGKGVDAVHPDDRHLSMDEMVIVDSF